MIYDAFATVYDHLMDDVDYDSWAEHYLALIDAKQVDPSYRLVECACGTGNLSIRLAKALPMVAGIDSASAMLRRAEEKARMAGVNLMLARQDMRNLTLSRPVDAVLCTCDGVNYLTQPDDTRRFFFAAYRALKPGGVFCFDVSSVYKLKEVLGNGFQGEERDGVAFLWQNRWDEQASIVQMDVTFFVREEGGLYRRFREVHRQRAHALQELEAWLQQAGFDDIAFFGEFEMRPPREKDRRIHVRARKPKGHSYDCNS